MADTDIDFDLLVKAGGPVRSFKAGDVIFSEGDPAAELLVVKSGTVEIRIRNCLIDTLGERSIFGEMALIDSRPRSATALALTDTGLIPLGDKGFSLLVAYHPEFALSVLRVMVKHLRATDAIIHQRAGW
jgi:CRP/FNR family transcriptional regulator, cyclic AMP receptor protein